MKTWIKNLQQQHLSKKTKHAYLAAVCAALAAPPALAGAALPWDAAGPTIIAIRDSLTGIAPTMISMVGAFSASTILIYGGKEIGVAARGLLYATLSLAFVVLINNILAALSAINAGGFLL